MHFLTLATAFTGFVVASSAQQSFHIYPYSVDYGRYQAEDDAGSYQVSFNISRPGAVPQQGGDASYSCYLYWRGLQPRSCYIPCEGLGNAQYWARLNPESFKEDNEKDLEVTFAVDVLEYFSYRNSVLQNATFAVTEKETPCYQCESSYYRGYTTDWCRLMEDKGQVTAEVETFGYGIYPVSDVVDLCDSWQGKIGPMSVQPTACYPDSYCEDE